MSESSTTPVSIHDDSVNRTTPLVDAETAEITHHPHGSHASRPISRGERSYVETPASDMTAHDTVVKAKHSPMPTHGLRLPPVPRRAHNMINRMVDKELAGDGEEREAWCNNEIGDNVAATGGANGPSSSPTKKEFVYESMYDPHLQGYWERRKDIRKIVNERKVQQKKQKQALYGPRGGRTLGYTPLGQQTMGGSTANSRGGSPRSMVDSKQSSFRSSSAPLQHSYCTSEQTSPDSTMNGKLNSGSLKAMAMERERKRKQEKSSAFPTNTAPFQFQEFLCLKTLLVPRPNFSTQITAKNCDLSWLRTMMIDEKYDEDKLLPSAKRKSFMNFNRELLLTDATQYNDDDEPFDTTLINSPRSTIVLLRNGVEPYNLMKRPAKFFSKVGEVLSLQVLKKRQDRAEKERVDLYDTLMGQYNAICAQHSLEEVVERLTTKGAGRSEEAQKRVKEKYDRDVKQLHFLEERTKKIAEQDMARREENAQRAFQLEATLKRKNEEKAKATKAKAEEVQEKLVAKRRILDKINRVRHEINVDIQKEMDAKREQTTKRVAAIKDEQKQDAARRAEQTEVRIQRSKELLIQKQSEYQDKLTMYERLKRQRAQEYKQRKAEEHEQLRQRQDVRHEKQVVFKAKAAEMQARLVANIEGKLEAAAERFEEFQQKRAEDREELTKKHREKERRIQVAIEQASAMHEGRAQEILERQVATDAKLAERRDKTKEQQILDKEKHTFELGHKHRVVDVRLQQQCFQKLFSVTLLQEREGEILEYESMKKEMARDMQKSSTSIKMRRDELKESTMAKIVEQERDIATRTYAITNPTDKYDVPDAYANVAPRTDYGQKEFNRSGSVSTNSQKKDSRSGSRTNKRALGDSTLSATSSKKGQNNDLANKKGRSSSSSSAGATVKSRKQKEESSSSKGTATTSKPKKSPSSLSKESHRTSSASPPEPAAKTEEEPPHVAEKVDDPSSVANPQEETSSITTERDTATKEEEKQEEPSTAEVIEDSSELSEEPEKPQQSGAASPAGADETVLEEEESTTNSNTNESGEEPPVTHQQDPAPTNADDDTVGTANVSDDQVKEQQEGQRNEANEELPKEPTKAVESPGPSPKNVDDGVSEVVDDGDNRQGGSTVAAAAAADGAVSDQPHQNEGATHNNNEQTESTPPPRPLNAHDLNSTSEDKRSEEPNVEHDNDDLLSPSETTEPPAQDAIGAAEIAAATPEKKVTVDDKAVSPSSPQYDDDFEDDFEDDDD